MSLQNPFLRGMLASQAAGNAQTASQINTLGGLLSMQNSMRQAAVDEQLTPLKIEQLRMAVESAKMNQRLREQAMGGVPSGAPAPMAFGAGGMSLPGGGQANLNTGQVVPPQPQMGSGGIDPRIRNYLLSGDPGLKALGQAMLDQQKPIAAREGAPVINPATGEILFYAPKLAAGVNPQFQGGRITGVSEIPGYSGTVAGIEGAVQQAQERERARFDLVTTPPLAPNLPPTRGSRLDALGMGAPQPAQRAPMPGPLPIAPMGAVPTENAARVALGNLPPETPSSRDVSQIDAELRSPNLNAQQRAILQAERDSVSSRIPPNAAGMSPQVAAQQKADEAALAATGKGRAESGVKYEEGILEGAAKAKAALTQLQILAPNLEKLPTGPLYPTLVNAGSYLQQFGINVGQLSKDLGPAQATDAILKQLALKLRNPAGGEGMPGALSDKDREFLVAAIPGLNKAPDGNKQLLDIMMKLEQRKVDEGAIVSRMQQDGKSTNEIRSALAQFAASRELFNRRR